MPGPGSLIAIDVILLYTLLGPPVLFVIYAFFDSLKTSEPTFKKQLFTNTDKKDPALWTDEEVTAYMDRL